MELHCYWCNKLMRLEIVELYGEILLLCDCGQFVSFTKYSQRYTFGPANTIFPALRFFTLETLADWQAYQRFFIVARRKAGKINEEQICKALAELADLTWKITLRLVSLTLWQRIKRRFGWDPFADLEASK